MRGLYQKTSIDRILSSVAMGKPKEVEETIIPPQDKKICGTICICQMTIVLSSVALVYLTVAIYVPSTRAMQSGIGETPIMCTTVRTSWVDNCEWGSCGEWCLSKTSGSCTQIHVTLRQNGSSILLKNCTNTTNKTCFGIDQENAKKSKCIADECKNLTGTFNCTMGICINITAAFECVFRDTDPPLKCSGRRGKITCIEITGLFDCLRGTCARIRTPYNCDRRCVDIPTRNKNVVLISGDRVHLSSCEEAGVLLDPDPDPDFTNASYTTVWQDKGNDVLMASCYLVRNGSEGVIGIDCINGALLKRDLLGDLTNFTYMSYLHQQLTEPLGLPGVMPYEPELIVANESRLMINLEGCVNTLKDECKAFFQEFGRDGSDHNARARYPCFYATHRTDVAVTRFDVETAKKEFFFAFVIPVFLFIISCLTLIFCQKSVVVGDDAKMRFKFIKPQQQSAAAPDSIMAL